MNRPNPAASGMPGVPEEPAPSVAPGEPAPSGLSVPSGVSGVSGNDDTLDLRLSGDLAALLAEHERYGALAAPDRQAQHGPAARDLPERPASSRQPPESDLLDRVGDWPASRTPVGTMRLVPVSMDRDLRLIAAWMNDPAVAAFWELSGPQEVTAEHLRAQLEGDGRSVPCLGVLDGVPMSYWEIYRADLDPIARYCSARPHDTGLHLLIGGVPDRGRGIGTALLRAVADLVLDQRPRCERVLAEPDVRNVASVAAFLGAGFRLSAEVDLPGKRAALMVRDRALREVL